MNGPKHYLSSTDVAKHAGVTRGAVTNSLRRHPQTSKTPFPEPDVYVGHSPGWTVESLALILEWFSTPAKGRKLKV